VGYEVGRNLTLEYREGPENGLGELAAELASLRVDLIVANGGPATAAAKAATDTIPIIAVGIAEGLPRLLSNGWIDTLSRPGGNLTGFTNDVPEGQIEGKHLALLKETLPGLSRVAHLWDAITHQRPYPPGLYNRTRPWDLGIELRPLELWDTNQLPELFEAAMSDGTQALISLATQLLDRQAGAIAGLAMQYRLPTMFFFRSYVQAGGLMAYGPISRGLRFYTRVAQYVAKVLEGTPPGELPIMLPTEFEFVINMGTARTLGLDIPAAVLSQATELIQ
jgi:putative ABC transport system substrate-binding protein